MGAEEQGCPLPEDPVLAEYAVAARETGTWTYIFDPEWRWVYMSDEARIANASGDRMGSAPLGAHYFSCDALQSPVLRMTWDLPTNRANFQVIGPLILADTPGGREELRRRVDPALADLVGEIEPDDRSAAVWVEFQQSFTKSMSYRGVATASRVFDRDGNHRGAVIEAKPEAGMATIARAVATGDPRHFERMASVSRARRQSAAILFADLEGSAQLSRRLSTAAYFGLGRRLVTAADAAIVDAGGIVGRHVGDGVVAFFLAETAGSESAAAKACIEAGRALRAAIAEVAGHSELDPGDVTLRFGLHWGSTLYMGLIATRGRSEVTALGDEVNEAARIEACASGGLALASKELVERLDPKAAERLGIDQDRLSYTPLAELPSATEKARRDAPAIAVCEV